MKLDLTEDLAQKVSLMKMPKAGLKFEQWQPTGSPNYLVYDTSRKAPSGFAVRVGPGHRYMWSRRWSEARSPRSMWG